MTVSRRRRRPESVALNAALAAELRGIIGSRQILQKDIAERFGWPQNWLSKRFSGEVAWGVQELWDVCAILDLDIKDILDRAHEAAVEQLGRQPDNAPMVEAEANIATPRPTTTPRTALPTFSFTMKAMEHSAT